MEEESDLLYAIEACSEVLDGKGHYVEDTVRHDLLCTRAALLLKVPDIKHVYAVYLLLYDAYLNSAFLIQRQWKNDVHMAIRDCKKAWAINPLSPNAHYHMAEALSQVLHICFISIFDMFFRFLYLRVFL